MFKRTVLILGVVAWSSGFSQLSDRIESQDTEAAVPRNFVELPLVVASDADPEYREAPLEDVWPSLSEPAFGDLDAMIERGEIRVLTTFTLGSYFIENGEQRGAIYELSRVLETYARQKIGKSANRLKVTMIPVRRDQLLHFLIEGHGDIAFANLTVTPERSEIVDFSRPFTSKARELLVTGPRTTEITALTDLAGKEIIVPAASSYYESITELNQKFVADGLQPIRITASDPRLEIDDILEMVSAGLLPMTVADEHRTHVWAKVFEGLKVHDDIVLRENAEIAIAMRKDSPMAKELLDGFVYENRVGTLVTNILIKKYGRNTGWARPALDRSVSKRLEQLAALFQTYGDRYDIDWLLQQVLHFRNPVLIRMRVVTLVP